MISDNGAGGFVSFAGSINYTSGAVSVPAEFTVTIPKPNWTLAGDAYFFSGWTTEVVALQLTAGSSIGVEYLYGDPLSAVEETHTLDNAIIDFVEGTAEVALGGSLRFTWGGHAYTESGGAVYADVSSSTGTGVWAGSLNPATRRVTLTTWTGGGANAPALQALRTSLGSVAVPEVTLKVAAPPIKQGGFTVRAQQLDGTPISATVNGQGDLLASGIVGKVQFEMGIAHVRFGDMVAAAGNEGQPWYDAGAVVAEQIFRPKPVWADTITFDATVENRSALPADVVQVDTGRMPKSGQLELVRPRDMLYFHHTDTLDVADPVAGAAVDCGRTGLERVWVVDADEAKVPPDMYTATAAELDSGTFHWADPLVTAGHPTPWTVYHRISMHRTVGTIDRFGTGRLRDLPFSKAMPAGAYVSSMLYAGNLQADWHVAGFFKPWTSWANAGQGDTPAFAYDYGNFPPIVKNNGLTIKTRMVIIMQSSTTFRVLLEGFGQIDTNRSITADYSPVNPATGQPILTITGNHSGNEPWSDGAAPLDYWIIELTPSSFPIVAVRCIQPSDPAEGIDGAVLEMLGNFG